MSRRCGCTPTLTCATCQHYLALAEGRASRESGWTAATSEAQLQRRIFQHLAKIPYWRGYHTVDSRRSRRGFPDLMLLRHPPHRGFVSWLARQIVAELKMPGEHPTRDQQEWLEAFWAQGAEVYIWLPNDEPEIVTILTKDMVRDRSTAWVDQLRLPLMTIPDPRPAAG